MMKRPPQCLLKLAMENMFQRLVQMFSRSVNSYSLKNVCLCLLETSLLLMYLECVFVSYESYDPTVLMTQGVVPIALTYNIRSNTPMKMERPIKENKLQGTIQFL